MKISVKVVFVMIACIIKASLCGMEAPKDSHQVYSFEQLDQKDAWQKYSLIGSFFEAVLRGCKFIIDKDNNFCFKNYYNSKQKYRISLETILKTAESVEMPDINYISQLNAYKEFLDFSLHQQSIVLQTFRYNSLNIIDESSQLFTKEQVLDYIRSNNETTLRLLDGFDIRLKEKPGYLDAYAEKMIQRNNNRKEWFTVSEKTSQKNRKRNPFNV